LGIAKKKHLSILSKVILKINRYNKEKEDIMLDKKTVDDLLNDLIEIPVEAIIAPREGEKYSFENILFKMSFTFEIIKEHREYYDILIDDKTPDVLLKDWNTMEMFNDGIITKI
jgi:hypothetical protein